MFNRRRGKHRGVFPYPVLWKRGISPGFHRGVYVEKDEWHQAPIPRPLGPFPHNVTIWGIEPQRDVQGVAIFGPGGGGIGTLPALIDGTTPGEPPVLTLEDVQNLQAQAAADARDREVREVVRDELVSTPIFTGLKYGRFGDSEWDLVEPPPVCGPLSVGSD